MANDQRYFEFDGDRARIYSERMRHSKLRREHWYLGVSAESQARFCRAIRRRPRSMSVGVFPGLFTACDVLR